MTETVSEKPIYGLSERRQRKVAKLRRLRREYLFEYYNGGTHQDTSNKDMICVVLVHIHQVIEQNKELLQINRELRAKLEERTEC